MLSSVQNDMATLPPRVGGEPGESEMGSLEFVTNVVRPAIAEIEPQCVHVPPKLKPIKLDLESLDKFIIRMKSKISEMADLDKYAEFEVKKNAIVEDICKIQANIESSVSRVKELSLNEVAGPVVSTPKPGIARIEIKIDSRTAWFEISCDKENDRFKGIRCEPVVENFNDLVSEQPVLNELIATMTRRFKKVLATS